MDAFSLAGKAGAACAMEEKQLHCYPPCPQNPLLCGSFWDTGMVAAGIPLALGQSNVLAFHT